MSPVRRVRCAQEFTCITKFSGAKEEMTSNPTSNFYAVRVTIRHMGSDRSGNGVYMDRQTYDKRSFRNLPRERCEVEYLFGPAIGPCKGLIALHHTDPEDPDSRLLQVCAGHHARLHTALRALLTPSEPKWKTCTHIHRYPEGKAACERRLNGVDRAA